jgi:hypothetical protein
MSRFLRDYTRRQHHWGPSAAVTTPSSSPAPNVLLLHQLCSTAALHLSAAQCGTLPPTGAPGPNATFFCAYATPEQTKCYYYYSTASSWFVGNNTCGGLSGVLFQPNTYVEQYEVEKYFQWVTGWRWYAVPVLLLAVICSGFHVLRYCLGNMLRPWALIQCI